MLIGDQLVYYGTSELRGPIHTSALLGMDGSLVSRLLVGCWLNPPTGALARLLTPLETRP